MVSQQRDPGAVCVVVAQGVAGLFSLVPSGFVNVKVTLVTAAVPLSCVAIVAVTAPPDEERLAGVKLTRSCSHRGYWTEDAEAGAMEDTETDEGGTVGEEGGASARAGSGAEVDGEGDVAPVHCVDEIAKTTSIAAATTCPFFIENASIERFARALNLQVIPCARRGVKSSGALEAIPRLFGTPPASGGAASCPRLKVINKQCSHLDV